MPRKQRDFSRAGPAIAPGGDDAPDTGAEAQQRVVRRPAGTAPLAAAPTAMRSAFGTVGAAAADAAKSHLQAVVIHRQREVPAPTRPGRTSLYQQIWDDLQPGDCAELPQSQANGMASYLKKHDLPHLVRRLSTDTKGVWRINPPAAKPTR